MTTGTNKTIASGLSEFEWEVRESRSGVPTLLLGGRAVYSQYDPVKNAAQLAGQIKEQMGREGCDHLVLIGSGLGYLPAALRDAGVARMVIWEPFGVMQKVFGHLYQDGPERVFDEHSFTERVKTFARPGAKPKIVVHPGYDLFSWYEYTRSFFLLQELYGTPPEPVISRRTLTTIRLMPELATVRSFENIFKGSALAIASPGPSLEQYLPVLKEYPSACVMAPLQAVPYLQQKDIRVDFAVNAEPEDMSDFLRLCSDDIGYLLTDTLSAPATLTRWPEKTLLFQLNAGQLHETLWRQKQLPGIEPIGATVSDVMVDLAAFMGFTTITCLGTDLCWRDKRYASRPDNRFDPGADADRKTFCLQTVDGETAYSDKDFFHCARYLNVLAARLKARGIRLIQAKAGLSLGCDIADDTEIRHILGSKSASCPPTGTVPDRPFTRDECRMLLENALAASSDGGKTVDATALAPAVGLQEDILPLQAEVRQVLIRELLKDF